MPKKTPHKWDTVYGMHMWRSKTQQGAAVISLLPNQARMQETVEGWDPHPAECIAWPKTAVLRVDAQGRTSLEATVSCCLHGQHNSQRPCRRASWQSQASYPSLYLLTLPLSFPAIPHPLHTCSGAPQPSSPLARGGGPSEGCCKGADGGMFLSKEPLSGSPIDCEPRSRSPCAPAAVWQPLPSGLQVQPSRGLLSDWQACTWPAKTHLPSHPTQRLENVNRSQKLNTKSVHGK